MARKTWQQKLRGGERKVVDDPKGRGLMLIPRPLDLDALIREVPAGRLVTVDQLRERLAQKFGADFTCPLVTGIFLRIVAEAAEEELREGKDLSQVTPWWRVVKRDGALNPKFPGGTAHQGELLAAEGHELETAKGTLRVKGFQAVLAKL
ncbi:MAG TPA: MGMT family protein [Candidatus Acetothermia bacterium]|nr:MGMT family protein [Candidatus Acetothermia bacterium]